MAKGINRIGAIALAGLSMALWAVPAQAVLPLEGRTINGAHVDAYDPRAVMEYDPNQDLTWLRDWNVNGRQTWQNQLIWAGSLHVGPYANWSLPTSLNKDGSRPCWGYNCIGSQMGYLWYEVLGNTANSFTHAGPFQNWQSNFYWSGTEYAPYPLGAWNFSPLDGRQEGNFKNVGLSAVAVRPGDVAAAAVPEPQAYALMLMGVGALMLALRRRPH